jgi:hypothetical protein
MNILPDIPLEVLFVVVGYLDTKTIKEHLTLCKNFHIALKPDLLIIKLIQTKQIYKSKHLKVIYSKWNYQKHVVVVANQNLKELKRLARTKLLRVDSFEDFYESNFNQFMIHHRYLQNIILQNPRFQNNIVSGEKLNSVLNCAINCCHIDIAQKVLTHCTPTFKKKYLKQLINNTCKNGSLEILKLLDNQIGDLVIDFKSSLKAAVENGHTNIVQFLLTKPLDASFDSNLCLGIACEFGFLEIVDLLMGNVTITQNHQFLLCKAVCSGSVEVCERLLETMMIEPWFDPGFDSNICVRMAVSNNSYPIFKLLTEKCNNVDVSDDDNFCAREASENEMVTILEDLLGDEKVDPTANDNECIQSAARNGNICVVKILLKDQRVDYTANDNYAIQMAAKDGHTDIVELLLGADLRHDRVKFI